MATAYKAFPQNGPSTLVGPNVQSTSFNIATGTPAAVGFVVGDSIDFFQIPLGATVDWFDIDFPILDTNVSPTTTLDIGTDLSVANGGLADNGIFDALNAGTNFSAAIVVSKLTAGYIHASLPFYYEAKLWGPGGGVQPQYCLFRVTFEAGPATSAVAGVIWATIKYSLTEDAGIFGLKNL